MVRTLLNILWVIFGGGLVLFCVYGLAAIICFIFIVTIPFGIASLRLAVYALWPFGRRVVDDPEAGIMSGIGNVIWLVFAGWWIALTHITAALVQAVTIIGIPFAIANIKLVPVALWPLGRRIVEIDD